MTISQVQTYEIVRMTKENKLIYENRMRFQEYCKKILGIIHPINNYTNSQDLCNDIALSERDLKLINDNINFFEAYYQDVNKEISNNKKILSIIKDTILSHIKNKEFVSIIQIKKYCNIYYVSDFHVWFFIDHLVSQNILSPLQTNKDKSKIIYKNNFRK